MTHQIFIISDIVYIMGRISKDKHGDLKQNWLEKPLMLTLMENDNVHFLTYDIFNKNDKIEIKNYISKYEPMDNIINEYERLLSMSENKDDNDNKTEQPKLKLLDFDKGGSDYDDTH